MKKTVEESIVRAMDGEDVRILPYLPYILQDFWEIGTSPEEVIALLEKHKPDPGQLNILDLGCGKGAISIRLAEKFKCRCTGVDAVSAFIEEANNKARELNVEPYCDFRVADIREEIVKLGRYDVIILGAIGPVFGNYHETLTILLPHLKTDGMVIINDAYIEDRSNFVHDSVLQKGEILRQIAAVGMELSDEIITGNDSLEEWEAELRAIEKRCGELIEKHPDKHFLFRAYVEIQRKEYLTMETEIVCATFLLKKMDKQQTKNNSASETRKLVATEYNGKWGFLDAETDEEIVPFIYDYAHSFSVGLALVRLNGWWGYVDKTGKEVIPCIYNPAYSFTKSGLAAVCIEGKCGFINQTGEIVIPLIYDDARYFNKDGKAKVKLNGETFFIDVQGERKEK